MSCFFSTYVLNMIEYSLYNFRTTTTTIYGYIFSTIQTQVHKVKFFIGCLLIN